LRLAIAELGPERPKLEPDLKLYWPSFIYSKWDPFAILQIKIRPRIHEVRKISQDPDRLIVSAFLAGVGSVANRADFVVSVSSEKGKGINDLRVGNFKIAMYGCGGPGERPDTCSLLPLKVTEVKGLTSACDGCYVIVTVPGPSGQSISSPSGRSAVIAVEATLTEAIPATIGGPPTIQVVAQGQKIANVIIP